MNAKQETVLWKRSGTKKHYKEQMQKNRCRAFLNQKLGTQTHKSCKEYDRKKERRLLKSICGDWKHA